MLSIFRKKNQTFKTNINCGGCIEKVKPFLDKLENIEKWNVNTSEPDKTLTVYGEKVDKEEVISAVKKAGFEINNK
ncbi:MAG: heavy-metal-associated domain-containing protein [Cytophagaceae bacterium]